jgi:hypothetical protein
MTRAWANSPRMAMRTQYHSLPEDENPSKSRRVGDDETPRWPAPHGGVPNQLHIQLTPDDRAQSFTIDRMVLYAEDPNRIGGDQYC